MAERGIRQIVVVENGRLLRRDQRARPLRAAAGVDARGDRGPARRRLDRDAAARRRRHPPAHAEPARAGRGRRAADAHDRLAQRRAVAPAPSSSCVQRHDLAGIDWCWLALGSEGRGEQTFATDQDNAMLFAARRRRRRAAQRASGCSPSRATSTRASTALGFPLCTGNVMASNPDLCLSMEEWKAKFLDWIREPTPQALLNANIVFDFRAALRRHDALRRAARVAVRLHAGESRCSCGSWCRTRSRSSRRSA